MEKILVLHEEFTRREESFGEKFVNDDINKRVFPVLLKRALALSRSR